VGPLAYVVQEYSGLASSLLARWSEHASKVATKLDDGSYDADGAAADLAACTMLAADTGFLLAAEALDAVAILTSRLGKPYIVDSEPFSTTLPGAKLELTGPLLGGFGFLLPVDVITLRPAELAPKATTFSLRADASGCPGGIYCGEVTATAGVKAEPVDVRITVP
jgi:hypothetical protein